MAHTCRFARGYGRLVAGVRLPGAPRTHVLVRALQAAGCLIINPDEPADLAAFEQALAQAVG